jgi:adenosylmethionine-8-amino-7-oxononanoate aminotransferase/NAD(P)-dependent dehydrogenase (short-subunit alcohol dehydrogenase family)
MSNDADKDLRKIDAAHHLHPFTDNKSLKDEGGPVVMDRGKGCYLWDENGHRYLDAMAGLWCVNVGYGRPELAEAARAQIEKLSYYNMFFKTTTAPTAELAGRLAEISPDGLEHVVFTNSGSEAVDSALRFARQFWSLEGHPEKRIIIGREEGYHGSTLASASAGGIRAMHEQAGLPLPDFAHIGAPYTFRDAGSAPAAVFAKTAARMLEDKINELGAEKVAAFIAEPIQGAGGVIIPPAGYLREIQRICREHDVLLIIDEVICAFGRLGSWTASEHFGLQPDMMTMAKGLSSGYQPIAAVMIGDRVARTIVEKGGDLAHGFTYAGHPVAAAVALENLRIIEREGLVERVRDDLGPYFAERLASLRDHPMVGETRSLGLIGAVEIVQDRVTKKRFEPEGVVAAVCRERMQQRGVIVRAVRDTLVSALPLVANRAEIDTLVKVMRASLDSLGREINNMADDRAIEADLEAADKPLGGRVALVTGASRGIGRAVAERYAREGAEVVLLSRDERALEEVAASIRDTGGIAHVLVRDMSLTATLSGLAGDIKALTGGLDTAVLNAGMLGEIEALPMYNDDAWDNVMTTNLTSNAYLLNELHPLIAGSDAGRVLLVTSGAARLALEKWSAYAASKAGLEALMRAYAAENKDGSIRVNAVDPGEARTGMRADAFPDEDPELLPAPDAITDAFVRLASPACRVTGAVVPV